MPVSQWARNLKKVKAKKSREIHSALKLEKKCNFQSTKTHFLLFQKWQKINFCTRKKFKITKNAIFGIFSGAKIVFLPFLKMQIMCFCTFEVALFFLILEHCVVIVQPSLHAKFKLYLLN